MTRTPTLLASIAALAAFAGCASGTKLVSTWRDPDTKSLECTDTIVLFASKNATMRAVVEDKIAANMKNATRARAVFDSKTARDPVALKSVVQARGFDCGVVVRFVGVDTETEYVPGRTYATGFYNYAGTAWTMVYEPGYLDEKRTVVLDTNVYDIRNDKLVWAARSRTVDPDQADDAIADLVDAIADAMRRDGLID